MQKKQSLEVAQVASCRIYERRRGKNEKALLQVKCDVECKGAHLTPQDKEVFQGGGGKKGNQGPSPRGTWWNEGKSEVLSLLAAFAILSSQLLPKPLTRPEATLELPVEAGPNPEPTRTDP